MEAFQALLRSHQYRNAYALWGCSAEAPCPAYSFTAFMEDWGPAGVYAGAADARLAVCQSCGLGVFIRLDNQGAAPLGMMVDRRTGSLGFAPPDWAECPGRHFHLAAGLRQVFAR